MKEIKDYLRFYVGCKIVDSDGDILTIQSVSTTGYHASDGLKHQHGAMKYAKPLLRPLSSMTEEDCERVADIFGHCSHLSKEGKIHQVKELFEQKGFYNKQTNITGNGWTKAVNYLRSKEYDCDTLIDDGLAIDSTKQ